MRGSATPLRATASWKKRPSRRRFGRPTGRGWTSSATLRRRAASLSRRTARWGDRPGRAHRQDAAVREIDTSFLEMSSRLAKAVPISIAACLSLGSVVCCELVNGDEGPRIEGALQPPPGLELPQTRNPAQAAKDGLSPLLGASRGTGPW